MALQPPCANHQFDAIDPLSTPAQSLAKLHATVWLSTEAVQTLTDKQLPFELPLGLAGGTAQIAARITQARVCGNCGDDLRIIAAASVRDANQASGDAAKLTFPSDLCSAPLTDVAARTMIVRGSTSANSGEVPLLVDLRGKPSDTTIDFASAGVEGVGDPASGRPLADAFQLALNANTFPSVELADLHLPIDVHETFVALDLRGYPVVKNGQLGIVVARERERAF